MIREIYIRPTSDPNFEPGIIDYINEAESVISQIKMILGTKKGEVFGEYDFGLDLEYLVFNTKSEASKVEDLIMTAVGNYVVKSDKTEVSCKVSFGDSGKGYDYAVIDIYINGELSAGFLVDK